MVLTAFGALLFAAATAHHSSELSTLRSVSGPVLAFIFDGVPALVLVAAGFKLHESGVEQVDRWEIIRWALAGAAILAALTSGTVLVRLFEGRVVEEPEFLVLVSAGVGANAGLLAGVLYTRARADARRAHRTSEALSFVNSVLRHDIRNNVGIVRGNASLIESAADEEDVVQCARTIRRQADESVQRIESASTIADTMVGDVDRVPVDLAAITEAVCERVDTAYEASITVETPETATVRANEGVQSVVSNLVENAVQHSDATEPEVAVRVCTADEHAHLVVEDSGPGVPEDLLDESDSEHEDGGLSLVQTLVDQFEGDVWVERTGPDGSVFCVELPRADEPNDAG